MLVARTQGDCVLSGHGCCTAVPEVASSKSKRESVEGQRLPISPEERSPLLSARREAKMTASAHAYVRGSTKRFYEWLDSAQGRSLPDAPRIWIGGDCHIGNLGPVAAKDGGIAIELRDLDQTVVGSPAHDVVRLCLSLAMAVRASGLPGAITGRAIESAARGYEVVLEARVAEREFMLEKPPAQVLGALREAKARSRKQLFAERLGKDADLIPMGKRFWPLLPEERDAVRELVSTKSVRKLITSLTSRDDDATVELVDAAYWVKGCSSLGLWRSAAIVNVGTGKEKNLALIDIKQATRPLCPHDEGAEIPDHQGERVVTGTRTLSPPLGERMAAADVLDKQVFVRELLPQDLKFELEALKADEASAVAHYLASVVAVAHARQLTPGDAGAWLTEFRKLDAKNLQAPAWLWAAVVDLVALHEGAYLEHCRKHALAPAVPASPLVTEDITSHHVSGD
jgi:uncharacterized protein (DUF2252 family)